MSLFGTLLKQGAKYADNLFDDVAVQAKQADGAFDEAAWLKQNPRPEGSSTSRDVRNWYQQRDRARRAAGKPGYNSIGVGSPPPRRKVSDTFDEASYLELHPKPDVPSRSREYMRWIHNKRNAELRSTQEGYDSLGDKIPEQTRFNAEKWESLNPRPEGNSKTPQVISWTQRRDWAKKQAEQVTNLTSKYEEYDDIGVPVPVKVGDFDYPRWLEKNPMPAKHDNRNDYDAWRKRRAIAATRAGADITDSLGRRRKYDSLGDRTLREDNGDIIPTKASAPISQLSDEQIEAARAWKHSNAGALAERSHNARSSRAMRDVPWAQRDLMKEVHQFAKDLEIDTGVAMDVDHAIPLRGDFVSGLNVPNNLQVMTNSWHAGKLASEDPSLNGLLFTDAFSRNNYTDHKAYIVEHSEEVAQAIADKQARSQGAAERLNHEIINPKTKIGRNAKSLWGDDYERYAEDIRKQIGLLGV